MERPDHSKPVRLFNNPILERLTKVRPIEAITYNLIVIGTLITLNFYFSLASSFSLSIFLFSLGYMTWSMTEYVMHRFLFHFRSKNKFAQKMVYLIHGNHHDCPKDPMRLFMPIVPTFLFSVIYFGIFYLILGKACIIFLAGFNLGYLSYDFIHYSIHTFKPPKFLRFIWTHHMKHHYQEQDKSYGVSTPFWDLIFHTMPKKKKFKVKGFELETENESSIHKSS
jgi:sterol desaturase/sphingolipid hydroxylase (fatty acid hydroxylase superfamily)